MPASPIPAMPGPLPPFNPAVRAVAGSGNTPLPRPLTKLVARERDLNAVVALLRDPSVRLLTLTGPGGVGKTRLAIAAAAELTNDFADGVVFVDLSPVADPRFVVSTIARCIGLRDAGAESLQDRVLTAIAHRRLLLVIDNFEQVVVAAPQLRQILNACPEAKLFITSRIRLRLTGEREFPVAPLPLDDPAAGEDAGASGAVRLFVERARAIRPEFDLSDETMSTIAEIVHRVDGLPLAIELAAARIKALPPAALLLRMEHQLPLLSGGARDLPLRQQTMRDTIGWSYDLLDDAEQTLFRRLGVFVGGFTLEAAEAIGTGLADTAGETRVDTSFDVLDGITALIEHSLLRQSAGFGSEPRYQMLETVREFARDRLTASDERDDVQRRHAAHFLAFVEASQPEITGPDQAKWFGQLSREKDNLRAALQWSLDQADADTAARLGNSLWRIWERRGYLSEGRSYLDRILRLAPSPETHAARCGALTGASVLASLQGDYDEAVRLGEDALASWKQIGDQWGIARSLLCLASVARYRDDYAAAESMGHESLAAFRAIGNRWGIGHVLAHLGMAAWVQGNHSAGTAFYEEALVNLRYVGDESGIVEVLLELGKGACDAGDFSRATTLIEECLELCTTTGDGAGRGEALTELGVVARRRGDLTRARDLFMEATIIAMENSDRRQVAWLASHLGSVDVGSGDVVSAVAHYAEALRLFLPMGNRVGIAQCLAFMSRCAAKMGQLSPAVRVLASSTALFTEIGVTPPPDSNPANDIEPLKSTVIPAEFDSAWAAGRAMSLAEAVADAIALAADLAKDVQVETPPEAAPASHASTLGLTPRETEVLRLLAKGMSDREIAAALSISERTAGNHVQHAMQKIEVDSRTAAAVFAVRHNLD